MKNLPRDSKKKSKVKFQDWLLLKKEPRLTDKYGDPSWGWSPNGKCYGWSHRAVYGFKVGDVIKPGDIGNKYRVDPKTDQEIEEKEKFEPYTIQTNKEAEEHAKRFAREVS